MVLHSRCRRYRRRNPGPDIGLDLETDLGKQGVEVKTLPVVGVLVREEAWKLVVRARAPEPSQQLGQHSSARDRRN